MLVATTVAIGLGRRGSGSEDSAPVAPATGAATTILMLTVRSDDLSRQADTMALFSIGGGVSPYVLLIPAGTLTDIPGYGFDMAGRALSFGRVPLAEVTVENMLGVRVDHTTVVEQPSIAGLVDRMGGIEVNVRETLYEADGQGRLVPIFAQGMQKMNGKSVVRYLAFLGSQETELSRLARQQQIWEGIFRGYAGERSDGLAKLVATLGDRVDGTGTAAQLGRHLAAFAALDAGARTFDVVPVSGAGTGEEQAFRIDDEATAAQVERFLNAALAWKTGPRPRLQLLNGNGLPESGIAIALKLVPAGFHLVDTGNTRSFDHTRTKILVYSQDAASMQVAQRVRSLLGRGEIEIANRPQTGIDITVVIGKDITAS